MSGDVKARLSRAIHGLTVHMAGSGGGPAAAPLSDAAHAPEGGGGEERGGALIQVWMPSDAPDGGVVLSAQVRAR